MRANTIDNKKIQVQNIFEIVRSKKLPSKSIFTGGGPTWIRPPHTSSNIQLAHLKTYTACIQMKTCLPKLGCKAVGTIVPPKIILLIQRSRVSPYIHPSGPLKRSPKNKINNTLNNTQHKTQGSTPCSQKKNKLSQTLNVKRLLDCIFNAVNETTHTSLKFCCPNFLPHIMVEKKFKNKEVPTSKHIRLRSLYTTRQLLLDLLLYNKKPYN